jgi:HlyD family secretion protein
MVQNVVTYDAVIGVDNAELLLKPGMTANAEFLVSRKEAVLKVPNAALRFRPPSERQPTQVAAAGQAAGASSGPGGGGAGRRGPPDAGQGSRSREGGGNRQGTVYVLREEKATPIRVRLGISDGTYAEVVGGDLQVNDQVILSMASQTSTQGQRRFFGF